MPMGVTQFKQCVNLALELMRKHTKEEDEKRLERKQKRMARTKGHNSKKCEDNES